MPTAQNVTVKSSLGDYSSLTAAEAGEQRDLVALDQQLDITCYAFEDNVGASSVTFDGWTTDATRYIRILAQGAPGGGNRHSGVWSTSAYRLVATNASSGGVLVLSESYMRLEGLQIHHEEAAGSLNESTIFLGAGVTATSDIRITDCILRGGRYNVRFDQAITVTLTNCVIYGGNEAGLLANNPSATVTAQNCTLQGTNYGARRLNGTMTLTNCYASGAGANDYNGTMTRTNCAHRDATVHAGSTASIARSTANFVNVTAGSEDYHLVSGASATLLSGGTDLSGSFSTDIDGETRSVPFSIGADQIISAPAGGILGPLLAGRLVGDRVLIGGRLVF